MNDRYYFVTEQVQILLEDRRDKREREGWNPPPPGISVDTRGYLYQVFPILRVQRNKAPLTHHAWLTSNVKFCIYIKKSVRLYLFAAVGILSVTTELRYLCIALHNLYNKLHCIAFRF